MEDFYAQNRRYIKEKVKRAKPSQHWKVMLGELADEQKKGRAEGPLQAPPDCGLVLGDAEGTELSPAPTARMGCDVRRGGTERQGAEVWRSSHNSTVRDCPHYNDVEGYAAGIQHLHRRGFSDMMIWGQDLAGAYRQLPVKPSDNSYTMLMLPSGRDTGRRRSGRWPPSGHSAGLEIA